MKIYTKTGDEGTTSLIGGTRVSKAHIRIQAYGTIDELNAYIGLLADLPENQNRITTLKKIQDRLFTIGSQLANESENNTFKLPELYPEDITTIETLIDQITEKVPPLRSFVLQGGHQTISFCHITRTVCRRAERHVIELTEHEKISENILPYLNRLSDYLFVLARLLHHELQIPETPWIAQK
ncbi:MAG: cob(I)yrinic acid a,c-diamide adenosyltransferase [Cytophagales bacterium]|nr:MAG: cob(I)yrinic acid a,c-diamide adenosyltransferase [Cytophagales bacterium]